MNHPTPVRSTSFLASTFAAIALLFMSSVVLAQSSIDLSLEPTLKQSSADGIGATFRFASPANRRFTGPLPRFARLFDAPQYQPMLSNRGTEIKLVSNDGFTAELLAGVVAESGELHWYLFRLSRQTEAPYENCWMTDGVMAVPHPGDSA